jgi:hypothetical protein
MIGFLLVGLAVAPRPGWGQEDNRIGTVLAVEGTAEVQAQNATTWETLKFRDAIFLEDTVRTPAASKVKVLLRDESIMTLGENSRMQFTAFLLDPQQQQRRGIVNLTLGKMRLLTTRLFGAGSVTEVHTPNTVAGVRGTTFVVNFIPPDTTEVISFEGVVTVRNFDPTIPGIEPVPQNFRTRVMGATRPTPATEVPASELRAIAEELQVTEHVPVEVVPTQLRKALVTPRGEQELPTPQQALQVPTITPPPQQVGAVRPGESLREVVEPQLDAITPDTSPAAQDLIEQTRVRIIVTIPR